MQKRKNVVIKNGLKNRVILNLTQDLQRLLFLSVNSMRRRFRIKYKMTDLYNNGGFTLIELLVIIVIIAILTAIGTSHYMKVKEKSYATQAITMLRALAKAQQVYYLNSDTYTTNFDDLDTDINLPIGTPKQTRIYDYTMPDVRSTDKWDFGMAIDNRQGGIYIAALRRDGEYISTYYNNTVGFAFKLSAEEIGPLMCYQGGNQNASKRKDYCTNLFQGTKDYGTSTGQFYKIDL